MTPKWQKVLNALQRAADQCGGAVCANSLCHPQVGGRRAAARVGELRARGHTIETVRCGCVGCRWAHDKARREGRPHVPGVAYRLAEEVRV